MVEAGERFEVESVEGWSEYFRAPSDFTPERLQTLERETEMLRVLQDVASSSDDPAVTIGGEHPTTGEWEASLITAPFHAGDQTVGTIGVVGPTRMDYLSAMASVRAVAASPP